MTEESFIKRRSVAEDFLAFLDLVVAILSAQKLLIDSITMAGYDLGKMDKPDSAGVTDMDKVIAGADAFRLLYENVREQINVQWDSFDDIKSSFETGKLLYEEFEKFRAVMKLVGQQNGTGLKGELIAEHLLKQLVLRSYSIFFPWAMQAFRLMNWVKVGTENDGKEPEKDSSGQVIRYTYRGIDFNEEGIDAFFDDPVGSLKKQYLEKKIRSRAVVSEPDDLLLTRMRDFLLSLNLNAAYGFTETDNLNAGPELDDFIEDLNKTLTTWFRLPGTGTVLAFSFLRKEDRIFITPRVNTGSDFSFESGNWNWVMKFDQVPGSFVISPDGVDYNGVSTAQVKIDINGKYGQPEAPAEPGKAPANTLGAKKGTRIDPGKLDFHAGVNLSGPAKKADLRLSVTDGKFILQPSDGDNFLKRILPENGLTINFDLAIGYTNERGFYLEGSGGGEITIPLNKQFGKISIPALQLGFRKKPGDDNWFFYASISGKLELGPVKLMVDKIGLALQLKRPEKNTRPNLLLLNADFDFKPPDGIGIDINAAGVVTGGGYLYIDRSRGEYFGVAALSIKNKIQLKAVGIIQTRIPGSNSYSFILLITAEFPAIQLGLGFSISGVGGLVGINRSMNLENLKAGVYNNTIGHILFPQNPVENAYSIISSINSIFPAAEGQYVFGLMAKLNWGPKNIITLEMGLILKIPSPVYIGLIGVLKSVVKKKIAGVELSIVELQVNFAAYIDFEKKFISFDAKLYKSKLLQLTLEGEIALRIRYNDNPDFAFTIGGFHPDFQPPALNLPAQMLRLKIIIRSGNPEITASCYFAITSNTVQFGIAGLFVFKKWGVGIRGELSFDALFQLSPFRFETALHFLLAASWKGYDFASIEVDGSFSGPSPWHITGSLKLKVWIFSKTVSLDETWGDGDDSSLERVDVLPLLAEDLQNFSSWEAVEDAVGLGVSLRKDPRESENKTVLIIHPQQAVTVSQRTLPLDTKIDRFAGRKPSGADKFSVVMKDKKGNSISSEIIQQHFASAQFIDLTEEEQLNLPPYERFNHGLLVSGLDKGVFDEMQAVDVEYEEDYVDVEGLERPESIINPLTILDFNLSLLNNSLSRSFLTDEKKSALIKKKKSVTEKFVIRDNADDPIQVSGVFTSKAEATRAIRVQQKEKGKNKTQSLFVSAVAEP